MAEYIKLNPDQLQTLRTVDPRLISYNVEMTEGTEGKLEIAPCGCTLIVL